MTIKFRKIVKEDSFLILEWRNHEDIRKHMYNTHIISEAEHNIWLDKVLYDFKKEYFILEVDSSPEGVVGFYDLTEKNRMGSWAFYKAPYSKQRGVGFMMEVLALNYYFNIKKYRKLNCEVLEHNMAVVEMHKKFGFQIEGCLKEHFLNDNDDYEDIYMLALRDSEWNEIQNKMFNIMNKKFKVNMETNVYYS